jgi:nucleotide-binding universal stress UspA family protein
MALLEREVEIQAFKEMEGFCKKIFDKEIPYTTEVVMGHPFEEIIKKAVQLSFDLIVVGTHGRTGLERVFVGSTSERLVRRSPVAVLTVRSGG